MTTDDTKRDTPRHPYSGMQFPAKPKAAHRWWCETCRRGAESLRGHQGHDLYRIGPKPPLSEERLREFAKIDEEDHDEDRN